MDSLEKVKGWNGNNVFRLTREIEVRKSDGMPYDQLTSEEQDALDDGREKSEYKIESVNVNIDELKKMPNYCILLIIGVRDSSRTASRLH